MRTFYGLSVTEKGNDWTGIIDPVYEAITTPFTTMEDAVNSAKKLLESIENILFIEVYVDTLSANQHEIKREYIARLSA